LICKLNHEVSGKSAAISPHSLIESLGRNAVEPSQISIQRYPLSAYDENAVADFG